MSLQFPKNTYYSLPKVQEPPLQTKQYAPGSPVIWQDDPNGGQVCSSGYCEGTPGEAYVDRERTQIIINPPIIGPIETREADPPDFGRGAVTEGQEAVQQMQQDQWEQRQ